KEAEKLQADLAKGGAGKSPFGEKADKLASELMELAQKSGPAMKEMAKESAKAVDDAKKAMQASDDAKAKGNADDAKAMADAAEKKLELAVKQLAKLAQDQAKEMKEMKPGDTKTADALKESGKQMRKAEEKLPSKPIDAEQAMKAAAKSLAMASQQAG